MSLYLLFVGGQKNKEPQGGNILFVYITEYIRDIVCGYIMKANILLLLFSFNLDFLVSLLETCVYWENINRKQMQTAEIQVHNSDREQ